MSSGTNTAGTLPHDQNAGRFTIPEPPPGFRQTPEGAFVMDALNRISNSFQQIQRALRTQAAGSVEVTVMQDMTFDGTNWAKVFIPLRVQASGATNTTTITGESC